VRLLATALALAMLAGCASGPATRTTADGEVDKRLQPVFDLMADKRYADAEKALARLARTHAEDPTYLLNLGIVYARTERLDQAEEILIKAQAQAPRSAVIHNELGIVRRHRGDFAGSASAYRAAIKADPAFANAHYNLGVLLDLYLQQPADALTHYEAYLSLTPQGDKTVNGWVKDLRRRTAQGPSTASQKSQVERR
jgi:Flp pilus assembly protein TadD